MRRLGGGNKARSLLTYVTIPPRLLYRALL
nr:MAG TPA: hypothetical protein [Caudoviricetes sp.]DAX34122.1 MAG TPA: hypothetical protein [Caudoviricetes sp.]